MFDELEAMDAGKARLVKLIGYGVCAVIFLIGLLTLVSGIASAAGDKAANDAEIVRLQEELAAYDDPENQVPDLPELNNAVTYGASVAEYQTGYQSILPEDERALSAAEENMKKYLADSDYLTASGPWLTVHEDKSGLLRGRYVWTFGTTYSTTEETLDVVWTCRASDGTLLGYVTGIYHGDTNRFSDIVSHWTWQGAYLQEPMPEPEPEPDPEPTDSASVEGDGEGEGGEGEGEIVDIAGPGGIVVADPDSLPTGDSITGTEEPPAGGSDS